MSYSQKFWAELVLLKELWDNCPGKIFKSKSLLQFKRLKVNCLLWMYSKCTLIFRNLNSYSCSHIHIPFTAFNKPQVLTVFPCGSSICRAAYVRCQENQLHQFEVQLTGQWCWLHPIATEICRHYTKHYRKNSIFFLESAGNAMWIFSNNKDRIG